MTIHALTLIKGTGSQCTYNAKQSTSVRDPLLCEHYINPRAIYPISTLHGRTRSTIWAFKKTATRTSFIVTFAYGSSDSILPRSLQRLFGSLELEGLITTHPDMHPIILSSTFFETLKTTNPVIDKYVRDALYKNTLMLCDIAHKEDRR